VVRMKRFAVHEPLRDAAVGRRLAAADGVAATPTSRLMVVRSGGPDRCLGPVQVFAPGVRIGL
jgi:hypothetical protein